MDLTYFNMYQWTDSGLKLLRVINNNIVKNGGEIRLALAIETEWATGFKLEKLTFEHRKNYNHIPWSRMEKDFVRNNLHLSALDLSLQMSRTPYAIQRKISYLRKQLKKQINGN